jgi:CheY-like chemotaxis protein
MGLITELAAMPKAAKILIAEDHPDSRDALRDLLEAFGYQVEVAVNGLEAVSAASECHPDLILMDIMMPELDGLGATRLLRAGRDTQGIPIIAVTAMEGAQQQALDAGASDYVRKPIDIRLLLTKVSSLLEGPAH